MKKYRNFIIWLVSLWVVVLLLYIGHDNEAPEFSEAEFRSLSNITQTDEKVGANVKLLQSIHGTEGTDYRYSIDTDCPRWDFHAKYVTPTMISWAHNDTSAVEVLIKDVQVNFGGRVYASGQYYTVPLLGINTYDNVSFEEWQNALVKEAYNIYVSEAKDTFYRRLLVLFIIGIPITIFITIVVLIAVNDIKEKDGKSEDSDKKKEDEEAG